MAMLEYENQMFLDVLHEDGLMITAKGLGLERVFLSLLKVYSDPGNLVLVLGTTPQEEELFTKQLDSEGVRPLPRTVTTEYSASDREIVYLEGGVLFVSPRILVVDLLKKRVPIQHVTGILVNRAHRILDAHQEAFAIRLFRQENKTGFIKAFSSSAQSFTMGFCQVERVMRTLFLSNLYLWPRFHATVNSSLEKQSPEVIELHLRMTPAMLQIQTATLDLINFSVKELKRINPTLDTDELTVENALAKSFHKHLQTQLDPIWHQLSSKTKQLIADLKTLRTILIYLVQYDCVTFYSLVSSLRTTEHAMRSGGWMLLDSAEILFAQSRLRVLGPPTLSKEEEETKKKRKKKGKTKEADEEQGEEGDEGKEKDDETTKSTAGVQLEVSPKWLALSEILAELKTEIQGNEKVEDENIFQTEKVLVLVEDERTAYHLREFLCSGSQALLKRLYEKSFGTNLDAPGSSKSTTENKSKKAGTYKGRFKYPEPEDQQNTLTQLVRKVDQESEEEAKVGEADENKEEGNIESGGGVQLLESPVVICHSMSGGGPFNLPHILSELCPKYVVMYDANMTAVRQLEIYQAGHPDIQLRVYFVIYGGTVEEQSYLTTLRREKEAFEFLIKEKATMVIPADREGRSDDHPDLTRDASKANETVNANKTTRKGGAPTVPTQHRIIVDMREFRSELPSLLHRRGIDVEPITLQVGDYILTPEICVERKSINDLIGSLNSGRLYAQAQSMTRHYRRPILLIEFDQNKPFALQGHYYISKDMSSNDFVSRLQLLTLHFPKLRLLWSPSPHATAEIFHELKNGRDEPDATTAAAIGMDESSLLENAPEKYNPAVRDFVSKLPGINSKNLASVLNKGQSLSHLASLDQDAITQLLGNSANGNALYEAIHTTLKPVEQAPPSKVKGKWKSRFSKR